MLNPLVFANRAVKNNPLFRVLRGFFERRLTQANGFSGDQNPLWVEAMEQTLPAIPLLANPVCNGND